MQHHIYSSWMWAPKKMALHWLNVYVSFGFWQLDQNPLDLNFFTKLGRAYFLRTLYLYYNFHDVFKKDLMFRVMFINWKEKPGSRVLPQNCLMVVHVFLWPLSVFGGKLCKGSHPVLCPFRQVTATCLTFAQSYLLNVHLEAKIKAIHGILSKNETTEKWNWLVFLLFISWVWEDYTEGLASQVCVWLWAHGVDMGKLFNPSWASVCLSVKCE